MYGSAPPGWPFATGGHETVYLVNANLEYPDFLLHILLIQELNFVLVYILARYHTYKGEFFASEVAPFLPILKSALGGSF